MHPPFSPTGSLLALALVAGCGDKDDSMAESTDTDPTADFGQEADTDSDSDTDTDSDSDTDSDTDTDTDSDSDTDPDWCDVRGVFAEQCNSCHASSAGTAGGLDLEGDGAYARIVDQPSVAYEGETQVVSSNSAESFLVKKIERARWFLDAVNQRRETLLRISRASGSVVDACVSLIRRSPRKFTVGLRGPPPLPSRSRRFFRLLGRPFDFGTKLL